MDISLVIYILITMLFSAFFSGMEIAYVSSNRMLAEVNSEEGSVNHRIVTYFYKHPNTFVSTMLVGNNIALVVYGILIANLFDNTIFVNKSEAFTVPADTILSTLIVLFTGEFLPKTIFKNNSNLLLNLFAPFALICYIVLYPISRFTTFLSRLCLRFFGVKSDDAINKKEEFSKIDLDYLVHQSLENEEKLDERKTEEENADIKPHGRAEEGLSEVRIFQNALELTETRVRDCMVPRTEINAIERKSPIAELRQKFIECGRSKIIVYDGDIDHIVGYIHSSELFRISEKWQSHIHTLPFVPETMAAKKLMEMLLNQRTSLAVVVDEFGGTSGIVSLEDIVEEIIGEIEDEHDVTNYECRRTSDGGYLISARLEIEKVNELLSLNLPESDDYKTVGGLILARHQSFPKLHEVITFDDWECKIVKNTKTKIELVKLIKKRENKE